MKLKKFILQLLGVCNVCGEPLSRNYADKVDGIKTKKGIRICLRCATKNGILKFKKRGNKKMNTKNVAGEIIKKVGEGKERVNKLKENVEETLGWILQSIKDIAGEIPDEKQFLDIVSEIVDEMVKLPQPLEMVDGIAIRQAIAVLDKFVLDKLLGKDWFLKLKSLIK